MACPTSPEPDRFHRYKLAAQGETFHATCVYCGLPKTLRPYAAEDERRATHRPTPIALPSSTARQM